MKTEITNAFGKVYLTIEYDQAKHWVYNNWIGYQTHAGIVAGADACLVILSQQHCPYLLNDNTLVVGPWDHAVEWIATDWTPRAIAQGLTHFAHVVSPESFAALSAEAMHNSIGEYFQMQIFGSVAAAQEWLQQARKALAASQQ
ncbi:STAS/SEC14 domain-containing protein [Hymenobacter sp. BT491]|uniref:STAS/SEC14 domain-containing protein n=1 Tax=Hymenobacter sp. BT491 TaxID=2766779 RepID=UPI001653DCB9|nr:STAS/SEC14 domain-containing protein [Hymenobacter sp. BT491]MBC6989809.1 STAS/SEC14 domain-containing protein [Hymenobacter sp. BT491]